MAFGCLKMFVLLSLTVCHLLTVFAVDISTDVGEAVTLTCPLTDSFPEWFGPPGLSPLTSNNAVTFEGMEYVNDKDLRINNVSLSHAGEYRCHGSEEAVVNLIINSYDYNVELDGIEDVEIIGKSNIRAITPTIGERFTIKCTVSNAYPAPDVTLTFPESNVTIDQSNVQRVVTLANNTYTVAASIQLTVGQVNEVDDTYVECTAAKGDKSVKAIQLIRVLHPPSGITTEGSKMLSQANHTGQYSCSSSGVWPSFKITWLYNGSTTLPSRFEPKNTCTQGSDGLYMCESTMIARFTKIDNGLILKCHIFYKEVDILQHQFTINYEWRPSKVTILGNAVDGPNEGMAEATCFTDSHNDQSPFKIMWTIEHENINTSFKIINETTADDGKYNGVQTFQTIQFLVTRNMAGYLLKCYLDFNNTIMDTKPIRVLYQPVFILPYSPIIHAYTDKQLVIRCLVDSVPPATLTMTFDNTALSINDDNTTDNSLTYSIAKVVDHGAAKSYVCTADNGVFSPVKKSFHIAAHAYPGMPTFIPASSTGAASVEFHTSNQPTTIPRTFYVQYKLTTSVHWLEMTQGIPDTHSGQSSRKITMNVYNLESGMHYVMRLKSVDQNGLEAYSRATTFSTPGVEETVTETRYRNAILISVFATFGFMLLLGAIIFCCYKRGVCCSRSKGIDLVAM